MDSEQHKAKAESLLRKAASTFSSTDQASLLATAQVHATLATVLDPVEFQAFVIKD